MLRLALLVCVISIAATSWAFDISFMSGLDSRDADSAPDSMEFTQGLGGGAADADIQWQSTLVHDSSNGGDNSSHGAGELNVNNTGKQAYYEPADTTTGMCQNGTGGKCTDHSDCGAGTDCGSYNCCRIAEYSAFPLDVWEATAHTSFHLGSTDPSGERVILAAIDDNGNYSCNASLDDNRKFKLYYGSELLSSPAVVIPQWACESPYEYLPCTDDSDCPGSTTCSSDIEYWAPLELHCWSHPPGLDADLYLGGHRIASAPPGYTPATAPVKIDTFRIGGVGTETESMHLWFDDIVVCEDSRCNFGFVSTMYPDADGYRQWSAFGTADGCGANYHYKCIRDHNTSPYDYATPRVQTAYKRKWDSTTDYTTSIGLSGDLTLAGVEAVAFGEGANTSGVRELQVLLTTNVRSINSPTVDVATADNFNVQPRQFMRVFDSSPYLDPTSVATTLKSGSNTASSIHVGSMVTYAFIQRPAEPLPSTIGDGNYGTDDGEVTVCIIGDSTSGASLTVQCVGGSAEGERCNVARYCYPWDATERDKLCAEDVDCQTCSGRRQETPGGLGYACDVSDPSASEALCHSTCDGGVDDKFSCDDDSDCYGGCSEDGDTPCLDNSDCTGTCTNPAPGDCILNECDVDTCSNNELVSCTDDSDCDALGYCQSNATCEESCPGGECPTLKGWAGEFVGELKYDNLVQCSQGGIGSAQFDTRWDNILNGTFTSTGCWALIGSLEPCDWILVMVGVNDYAGIPAPLHAPNCEGIFAGLGAGPGAAEIGGAYLACNPPTDEACMDDSDCSDVSPDSYCIGREIGGTVLCSGAFSGYGVPTVCTVKRKPCATTADCGSWGVPECTENDADAWYPYGACLCDSDSDCEDFGPEYDCDSGICHRTCVANKACKGGVNDGEACTDGSECEPDGTCDHQCSAAGGCNTGAGLCYGTCTYPSNARECDTAADCISVQYVLTNTYRYIHGSCSAGKCLNDGLIACPEDTSTEDIYEQWYLPGLHGHHFRTTKFDRWQQSINDLSEPGSKLPKVVFMTVPDTGVPECYGVRGEKRYINRTNTHILYDAYCSGGDDPGQNCSVDTDCGGAGTCERRYPLVVDTRAAMDAYRKNEVISWDGVHFLQLGDRVVGHRTLEYLLGVNTCAVNVDTPDMSVQRYCRTPGGDWDDDGFCTPEDELTDCLAGYNCQVRTCLDESDCPGAPVCNLVD